MHKKLLMLLTFHNHHGATWTIILHTPTISKCLTQLPINLILN